MSIVGAVISPGRDDIRRKIAALASSVDQLVETETSIVVAIGAQTVLVQSTPQEAGGGVVAIDGSPVVFDGWSYARPDRSQLVLLLQLEPVQLHQSLMGQYSMVRTRGSDLELVTDPNSLRSFFLYRDKDFVLFASRLQGITGLVTGLRLGFEEFGSHWLAHNQLNESFFVRDVTRLSGRRTVRLRIESGAVRLKEQIIQPLDSNSGSTRPDGIETFLPVKELIAAHDGPVRLALSGGIDSRLLLAVAARSEAKDFGVIAYETKEGSDTDLANQLAGLLDVSCHTIPASPIHSLIVDGSLDEFALESFCHSPLSASTRLTHYAKLYSEQPGMLLLDGAFGEVGRAQFYRRVELLRRFRPLGRSTRDAFTRALCFPRADIFNEDAVRLMREGFESDVVAFVQSLDNSEKDRPEDWQGVRYRRSNFFGYSQSWLDRFGFNFMPLGQETFVRRVLELPLSLRRGGKFYRHAIRKYSPEASRIPLSKGTVQYPFHLTGSLVPFYVSVTGWNRRKSASRESVWTSEHNYVADLVQSPVTTSYGPYDMRKINTLVDDFYGGRAERHSELDWFLSFELWRRGHHLV